MLQPAVMGNNSCKGSLISVYDVRFVWWIHIFLFTAAWEALPFILLRKGDLLIASANCWRGVQIVFKEMHLGMIQRSN